MVCKEYTREIFEKVKTHLLKQMKKSCDANERVCLYRSPEGLSCAIGCLINDEVYSSNLEHASTGSPKVHRALKNSGIKVELLSFSILPMLQAVHDNHPSEHWKERLDEIEYEYEFITRG